MQDKTFKWDYEMAFIEQWAPAMYAIICRDAQRQIPFSQYGTCYPLCKEGEPFPVKPPQPALESH